MLPWNSSKRRRLRKNRQPRRKLLVEMLESRYLLSGVPLLDSWLTAYQGEYAEIINQNNVAAGAVTTWTGQTTAKLGDVQKISYSSNWVYVQVPDLASYVMGPWYLNAAHTQPFPNLPKDQNATFRISRNPAAATTHTTDGLGAIAVAVDGVSIFNSMDGFSWNNTTQQDSGTGSGYWNRNANYAEEVTFDHGHGHQPGNGEYHYHANPTALRAQLDDNLGYTGSSAVFPYDSVETHAATETTTFPYEENTTNLHHSPILGWSFDGYPIYGPYGYSNPNDATSSIERIDSSFRLRNITQRTSLPGWAAQAKFGDNVALNANGEYTLTSNLYGPAVSAQNPLGKYIEDYEYVPGLGGLDKYNGRFTVTPEFPSGTYAYFTTIDSTGDEAFPYFIGRQYYGQVTSGRVASIGETVTVSFDVTSVPTVSSIIRENPTTSPTSANSVTFRVAFNQGVQNVDATDFAVNLGTLGTVAQVDSSTYDVSVNNLAAANGTLTLSFAAGQDIVSLGGNHLTNTIPSGTNDNTYVLAHSAPVVSGPATANAALGNVFVFTGANAVSINDSDAGSNNELVALSVSSGTLSLNTSGITVTSGATGTTAMTISGTVANLNTALATLQYSAPNSGSSATLAVVANDGSSYSNTLVTTITFSAPLTLSGTSGDDVFFFQFTSATTFTVIVNGTEASYSTSQYSVIDFDGISGTDSVTVVAQSGSDTVSIGSSGLTLQRTGAALNVSNADWMYVWGDSSDTVSFTGSANDDVYYGYPNAAIIAMGSHYAVTVGIANSTTQGSTGQDAAVLVGSSGDDTLTAHPNQTTFVGPGFSQTLNGWTHVYAFGQGGTDIAHLYDDTTNDEYHALNSFAVLLGPRPTGWATFLLEPISFGTVRATASAGGTDLAVLYDTTGDETFSGNDTLSALYNSSFRVEAESFDYVYGLATSGGNDSATIDGSTGNDYLFASGPLAQYYSYGNGAIIQLYYFDTVTAKSNGGSDGVHRVDPTDYVLTLQGTWTDV